MNDERLKKHEFWLAVVALQGIMTAAILSVVCYELKQRVTELETRAAWFMPEGQGHVEGVRR